MPYGTPTAPLGSVAMVMVSVGTKPAESVAVATLEKTLSAPAATAVTP